MYYKIAWDSSVQNVGSNGNPTSNARLNMSKRLYGQQYMSKRLYRQQLYGQQLYGQQEIIWTEIIWTIKAGKGHSYIN